MSETQVGHVSQFFARPLVAGVELTAPLKRGDTIRIKGHTTDLTLVVDSMQVDNRAVEEAARGQAVGIKVPDRVRPGDAVLKVLPDS